MSNDNDEFAAANEREASGLTRPVVSTTTPDARSIETTSDATTSMDNRYVAGDDQIQQEILAKQQGRSSVSANPGTVFPSNNSKNPPHPHNLNTAIKAKQSKNEIFHMSTEVASRSRNTEVAERAKVYANFVSMTPAPVFRPMKEMELKIKSKCDCSALTSNNVMEAKEACKLNGSMQDIETEDGDKILSDLESAVMLKAGSYVATSSPITKASLSSNKQYGASTYETEHDVAAGSPNLKSSSLEYELYSHDGDESGLAVALPIDEDHEMNMYLPSAVEYDSDAKPPAFKNRRFRLYTFLLIAASIVGTIGAVLGIIFTEEQESIPTTSLPYRATIGIREKLALFISEEYLDDIQSPYRKALDWITYTDPMAITPDNSRFVQRYILAYFYYATSTKRPWTSRCAPSFSSESESDTCKYEFIRSMRPIDDRTNKTGTRWLSNTDECKWAGLQCDGWSQIRKITLGGMGIMGTFPEGLVWLPYLQSIRIGFDEIVGPLPDYLIQMKHLHEIALPGNMLTGTIPNKWLESRLLNVINVEGNAITGTIGEVLSQKPDVQELIIRDNNFTGTIPNELGSNGINMVNLRMDGNRFNGTLPTTLGKMEHISIFDVSNNFITGTIPDEIGSWTDIGEFFISNNLITGTIPEKFWNAEQLIFIDMSDNRLNGTISGKISKLHDLISISIKNNQFTGEFPARFGQTYVKYIYASGNQFNGTVPTQLCDLVTEGQLTDLTFDCASSIGGNAPEVICPDGCCSLCCNPDGENCV